GARGERAAIYESAAGSLSSHPTAARKSNAGADRGAGDMAVPLTQECGPSAAERVHQCINDGAPTRPQPHLPRMQGRWGGAASSGTAAAAGAAELTRQVDPPICQSAAVQTRSAYRPQFPRVPCLAP